MLDYLWRFFRVGWKRYRQHVLLFVVAGVLFAGAASFAIIKHREENRQAAIDLLRSNYGMIPPELQEERQALMREYGITENDINPRNVWEQWRVK